MTKTEQLMEHLKDVALMFGYDIEDLEVGHVTHRPACLYICCSFHAPSMSNTILNFPDSPLSPPY